MKRKPARRSVSVTEKHYRSLFRELGRSGQSVREFAEQRGLSPWTLYTWRSRLGLAASRTRRQPRGEAAPRTGRQLLEVAVAGERRAGPCGGGLVLHVLDTYRVELPRDVTEAELRRLVAALSAC